MIAAFDPNDSFNFNYDGTVFKLRRLTGREFIKYRGMMKTGSLKELRSSGLNIDSDIDITEENITPEQIEIISERMEIMSQFYSENLDSNDFLLKNCLIGWENEEFPFDEAMKLEMLTHEEYIAISQKVIEISTITEEIAKK